MLLENIKDLAYAAGRVLRDKFETNLTIEYKGEIDLVTDADKAAEDLVSTISGFQPCNSCGGGAKLVI